MIIFETSLCVTAANRKANLAHFSRNLNEFGRRSLGGARGESVNSTVYPDFE